MAKQQVSDSEREFPQTRWSLVVQVHESDQDLSRRAMEDLCAIYWKPVYGFIRGKGWKEEEAKDLTQGFFTHLLQKESLLQVSRERGKLRFFLLLSLIHI